MGTPRAQVFFDKIYLLVKVGFANDDNVTLFCCLDIEEWRFSRDNRQNANKLTREGSVQVVL